MNRRSALLAAMAVPVLFGCASRQAGPRPVYLAERSFSPLGRQTMVRDERLPAVGEVAAADVGETIVWVSRVSVTQGARLGDRVQVLTRYSRDYLLELTVEPGGLPLIGQDQDQGRFYESSRPVALRYLYPGQSYPLEMYRGGMFVDGSVPFVYWFWNGAVRPTIVLASAAQLEVRDLVVTTEPAFRRELVYAGRSGWTVSLMYREFAADMARPAFTQALQYDLSSSPVIGFRSARFEVLSATNTGIRYRVLSPLA